MLSQAVEGIGSADQVYAGAVFGEVAWVEGLRQNEENRSSLAPVNTGEADDSESIVSLRIHDGETDQLAVTITKQAHSRQTLVSDQTDQNNGTLATTPHGHARLYPDPEDLGQQLLLGLRGGQ